MKHQPELVSETEWSRTYRVGENKISYESKFFSDHLEVDAEQLIERWPRMTKTEQHDFARAFRAKRSLSRHDERILEFLMVSGDQIIWTTISLLLCRHPKRDLVADFILARVNGSETPKTNYYQAAEQIGDPRFVPALERQFGQMYTELGPSLPEAPNLEEDRQYLEFLQLCRTLLTITRSNEYERPLRVLLDHPSEVVRNRAKRHLGVVQ
jgi:hypothetical protein